MKEKLYYLLSIVDSIHTILFLVGSQNRIQYISIDFYSTKKLLIPLAILRIHCQLIPHFPHQTSNN